MRTRIETGRKVRLSTFMAFICATTSLIGPSTASAEIRFRIPSPLTYPTGGGILGDLNGDGYVDLLLSDDTMLGLGDGTFAAPHPSGVHQPSDVGDLDGDGILDAVRTAETAGTIAVQLGFGDGTFGVAAVYDTGRGRSGAIALGDVDGDGRLDLVSADAFRLSVNLNLGNGTLGPPALYTLGLDARSRAPSRIAIGDFTGDGLADVAAPIPDENHLAIFRGTGGGLLTPQILSGVGALPTTVLHLGGPMLAVLNRQSATVSIERVLSSGGTALVSTGSASGSPFGIASGDLNHDGWIDLVTADEVNGEFSIFMNQGSDQLGAARRVSLPGTSLFVAIADVNEDGRLDLLAGTDLNAVGSLAILPGTGDGRFAVEGRFATGRRPRSVLAADLSGDGLQDVVTGNFLGGDLSILLGLPGGGLYSERRQPACCQPAALAHGDFDGDGVRDLAVASGAVFFYKGQGGGSFAAPASLGGGVRPEALVVGDFNSDGLDDIAAANAAGSDLSVFIAAGGGAFLPETRYGTTPSPTALVLDDFNGDGRKDLVASAGGSASYLAGRADGTFAAEIRFPVTGRVAASGDFDRDGRRDLIAVVSGPPAQPGHVIVLPGNGNGTFQTAGSFPVGSQNPTVAVVTDFDRDGFLDVAVGAESGSHTRGNIVSVLSGRAGGAFGPPLNLPLGSTPRALAIGDFNGDGLQDIVAACELSDDVALLTNDSLQTSDNPPVADPGPDITAECTSQSGATITLDGTRSSDPDSTPGTNDDILSFEWFITIGSVTSPLGTGSLLSATFSLGSHRVTLRVTDRSGNVAADDLTISVVDTTPPAVTVILDPATLWPPNHRMVDVAATVTAQDVCSAATLVWLDSVVSSDPDDDPGGADGNTTDDVQGVEPGHNDFNFQLRAERGDPGGRAYTVTYTGTDNRSNFISASAVVFVPHDQGGLMDPLDLRVDETETGTSISWSEVIGARFYNVVRGRVRSLRDTGSAIDLGALVCMAGETAATKTPDLGLPGSPSLGDIFFYLVEYDDGRPSAYGTASSMKEYAADPSICATRQK